MEEERIRVDHETLEAFVSELFVRAGMVEEDAAFHGRALVQTNLWGIDSHGVLRVPVYIERLQSGAMNPRPDTRIVKQAGALAVMHGDDGPGFVVGRNAMRHAVELAAEHSLGAVGVIHSNHFGAAGIYARLATDQDMIGIAMTNVIPNIVAPGGSKPVTGNNPLAVAVPTFSEFPFVLDMSLSTVAGGKLLLAMKQGERIPLDWATDAEGRPTDDPERAFDGFLLPVGGYKGLGLSYVVDILSGLITGGVFGWDIKSMYRHRDEPSLTCHFMIAIDALAIMDRAEMEERMAAFHERIKTSPMWDDSKGMYLPGEIEYRTSLDRRRDGIPISGNLYDDLRALGERMGASHEL
jgi:LDH2 family malate/lactate/ureidoglycolate dehydrogenase